MAITCLIYLIIYIIISIQLANANRSQVATAAEAVMAPVYQSNQKQLPMTVSHHHQTCTISSQPYQGSVPVMMAVYPPQAPTLHHRMVLIMLIMIHQINIQQCIHR